MHSTKVKAFLDANAVKYVVISHSKAYTAQGIAAISHIRGKELAKSVMMTRIRFTWFGRQIFELPLSSCRIIRHQRTTASSPG